jgi:hypothetical protein
VSHCDFAIVPQNGNDDRAGVSKFLIMKRPIPRFGPSDCPWADTESSLAALFATADKVRANDEVMLMSRWDRVGTSTSALNISERRIRDSRCTWKIKVGPKIEMEKKWPSRIQCAHVSRLSRGDG